MQLYFSPKVTKFVPEVQFLRSTYSAVEILCALSQSTHEIKDELSYKILMINLLVALPPLKPASTWTSLSLKELKAKMRQEKDSVVNVYRGDIMTVHVPTDPEAKRVCWEFATDGYDIGFGVYFDWSPVTSRAITVHISESSDDEDEDDELGEGEGELFVLFYASKAYILILAK